MGLLAHPLNDILGTQSKVRVLRELATREDAVTGREAGRLADLSPRSAQQALSALHGMGIVRRQEGGRSYLYRLNRQHYLVQHALEKLFRAERRSVEELFEQLRGILSTAAQATGTEIVSGIIFGSTARGEDRPESDMDLLVIHGEGSSESLREELAESLETVESLFGRPVSPVIMSSDRFRDMMAAGADLVADIRDDGRRVYGAYVGDLVDG